MAKPLYKFIQDHILHLIEENKDNRNYMLPSENQLAIKLNASRVSVRKALAELEEEGKIYKVKGKGSFINNAPGAPNRPGAESSADIFAYICPDFTTAFPREIARGISDGFKEFNANTIYLSTYGSASKEEAAINLAKNLGCKGLVIMPSDEDNYNNAILSLAIDKFPTVLVDRLLFGLNLTCVSSDHYQIGYIAADFLAKKHSAVCMISLNNIVSSIRNRIEGFNHGLAAHRIHHPHHLIFKGNSTLDEITAYFAERPNITGIVCNSGHIFYLLIQAMHKLGKELNKDFEVITLDGDYKDLNATLGLKTFSLLQDDYRIGFEAATMLARYIYHNEPLHHMTVPLLKSLDNT